MNRPWEICGKCVYWTSDAQKCNNELSERFEERTMGNESCEAFEDYDEDRNID